MPPSPWSAGFSISEPGRLSVPCSRYRRAPARSARLPRYWPAAAYGHGHVRGFRAAPGGIPPTGFPHALRGAFRVREFKGLNWLLSMNAAATGIYAISVVLITYEMSRRIANTGWLQLVVSGLIVLGIALVPFHSDGGDRGAGGTSDLTVVRGLIPVREVVGNSWQEAA